MKPRNKGRAVGQTKISMSLPCDLLAQLDAIAAAEGRNRSNTIVHLLRQQIKARKSDPTQAWVDVEPASLDELAEVTLGKKSITPAVLKRLALLREESLRPSAGEKPRAA